jgi:hypothetical protein
MLFNLKLHIPALILGSAILLSTSPAQACSCASSTTPFVQRVKFSQAVIRAKVLNYQWNGKAKGLEQYPPAMALEVQEMLKGKVKPGKLTVWGGNGLSCNPYVSNFPIGTEWIFALSNDRYNHEGGLSVTACGESALAVKGGTVFGGITVDTSKVKPRSLSLRNFRTLLKAAPR